MERIQDYPEVFRDIICGIDDLLVSILILFFFHFNSRMKRNCTPLGKKWKFPALLGSHLLDTSTSDVYQTGPGGEETWNANVRPGQTSCVTALKNECAP